MGDNHCKKTLVALFLTSSLIGCSDRNDVLEEIDTGYPSKCASFATKTDLKTQNNTFAQKKAGDLKNYWQTMSHGQSTLDALVKNDTAICTGLAKVPSSGVLWNKKANAWLISENTSNERAARQILWSYSAAQYRDIAKWSEKLVLDDALLYSRIEKAHEINIQLAEAYYMSGKYFNSKVWDDAEKDPQIGEYAKLYREVMKDIPDMKYVHTQVLYAALGNTEKFNANDKQFLEWYDQYLHDQTYPVMSFCLDFEGNLDPCVSYETSAPAETTAASEITAEALVELSNVWMPDAYLTLETAQHIIDSEKYREVSSANIQVYKQVADNVEACCSTESRNSDSSFGNMGIGLGKGSIGISTF